MLGFSFGHILIVAALSVMLFGKRLPEVARTVGKHLADFKRNLRSIEEAISTTTSDVTRAAYTTHSSSYDTEDREEATAPRFEPPPAAASEPRSSADTASAS